MRTPEQILNDFDAGSRGVADVDMWEVLWEVINDVRDSFSLAMRSQSINPTAVREVETTVADYVAKHYGIN